MMSKISIILPTYNREKYLEKAIKSVLCQTYKNYDLIIIDDGSTDNTDKVIKRYINNPKIIFIKQSNKGAAAARNAGIKICSGDYIAFIDSDDIWKKRKLEYQLKIFDMLPDIGLVCSDFSSFVNNRFEKSHLKSYFSMFDDYNLDFNDIFSFKKNIIFEKERKKINIFYGDIYEKLLFGNFIPTSTCLIKKEILNKVGLFNEKYKTLEDYDLWLKVTKNSKIAFVEYPTMIYYYNKIQLSGHKFKETLFLNLIDIFTNNLSLCNKKFIIKNKQKIKKCYSIYYTNLAYYYFAKNNLIKSKYYYTKGIKKNPYNIKAYLYLIFTLFPKKTTIMIRTMKKYLFLNLKRKSK